MTSSEPASSELVSYLRNVLLDLSAHPYPVIPTPPSVKKRASVAVIVRIQPHYSHWPTQDSASLPSDPSERVNAFFDQDWVSHGDPEVLFIKRATREGDKWNGHVALPGGRRDPEDEDDLATAVRETREEVGIDLETLFANGKAVACGNLPQRVVTTSWGRVPLMVLCPYLFLVTSPSIPPLKLQPTEVASTHWVSLRALLSPAMRTVEYQDVSNRFVWSNIGWSRLLLKTMLGDMTFAAVKLLPSESLYCSSIEGFVPTGKPTPSLSTRVSQYLRPSQRPKQKQLLLWGLTLGIMADFLDMLPPHNALR
ncbi:hypothetical protein LTS18_011333, partial [Coniosporium uncinatum]